MVWSSHDGVRVKVSTHEVRAHAAPSCGLQPSPTMRRASRRSRCSRHAAKSSPRYFCAGGFARFAAGRAGSGSLFSSTLPESVRASLTSVWENVRASVSTSVCSSVSTSVTSRLANVNARSSSWSADWRAASRSP